MGEPGVSGLDSQDSSQIEEGQVDQESGALNDTGEHPEQLEKIEAEVEEVEVERQEEGSRPDAPALSNFSEDEESPGLEGEAFDGARRVRDEKGLLPRISSIGITLLIVLALLYIVKDIVPPALVERVVAMAGLEQLIPLDPGLEAKIPVAQETYDARSATEVSTVDAAAEDWAANEDLQELMAVEPVVGPAAEPAADPTVEPTAELSAIEAGLVDSSAAEPLEQPEFPVRFMHNSGLLETEAWHVLDSVALVLRQEPDSIAIIRDEADSAQSEELSLARVTVVERYLIAAGIESHRIQIGNPQPPVSALEEGVREADETFPENRFVYVSIEGDEL